MKNTPTPWEVGCANIGWDDVKGWHTTIIFNDPDKTIYPAMAFGQTKEECLANAELIVKAVNFFVSYRKRK